MWQIQFSMQIPITIVGLYLEFAGLTGPWALSFNFGPCSASLETYGLINLVWMFPFIVSFLYDPNLMFGPSTFTGFPMFTATMGETELWFGKTWAVLTAAVLFGPYVFGCPIAKT